MTYEEIIEQTYISPIRSVIALDDDFPTLDKVLDELQHSSQANSVASQPSGNEDAANPGDFDAAPQEITILVRAKEIIRATEVVRYCRSQQWIVDVNDGAGLSLDGSGREKLISHLHQTDLLILDYQLEGEAKGGDSAVRVLRFLAQSDHFNLVVVYTKKNATEVFREIALALLSPTCVSPAPEKRERIGDKWDDWTAAETEVMTPFQDIIDEGSYLTWRKRGANVSVEEFSTCFSAFSSLPSTIGPKLAVIPVAEKFTILEIGAWLIWKFEERFKGSMSSGGLNNCEYDLDSTTGVNWIWAENLYLTVVPKTTPGNEIVERLKQSLCSWHPTPHHILLAKMRTLLEDGGGKIEATALRDKHVQAGLLWELLDPQLQQRESTLSRVLERQWAEVLYAMKAQIKPQALVLLEEAAKAATSRKLAIGTFYPGVFDPKEGAENSEVWLRLNSYWSSVPAEGHHLKTGHIFRFEDSYWICLSPICDLVPEQNHNRRWRRRLGQEIHFKAVKLHTLGRQEALNHATGGACLYLRVGDAIETVGFVNPARDDANPDWEQMFALNKGRFSDGMRFKLTVVRERDGALRLEEAIDVPVIGQLRYEYALNLLQRLGNNMSRVGLDFVHPEADA